MRDLFSGNWSDIQDYDKLLVDQNLKVGQLLEVTYYLFYYWGVKLSQGEFKSAYLILVKLSEIAKDYEYEIAKQFQLFLEAGVLIQYRNLYDAQKSVEKAELDILRGGSDILRIAVLGGKAIIQILSEDLDGAEKSLSQA